MTDKLEGREISVADKIAEHERAIERLRGVVGDDSATEEGGGHDGKHEAGVNGRGDVADVGAAVQTGDGDFETLSHRVLAEYFAESAYGRKYNYDERARVWREWDGRAWREAGASLMVDIGDLIKDNTEKQSLLSLPAHNGVKGLAEALLAESFDQQRELLGLPDQVLNTETAQTAPMLREHRITRTLSPGIRHPAETPAGQERSDWERFVWVSLSHYDSPAFPNGTQAEVYSYLQQWAGSALTGDCRDEQMLFLWGKSGTGKGTFGETLCMMFGDYGHTVNGARAAGFRDDHLQWIAQCEGKLYLLIDEVPDKGRWKTDILNPLVSGQLVETNRMRQDSFVFRSKAHVLATGNHRPSARSASGIFRRLVILEFQNRPAVKDNSLKPRLAANLGDVYRWSLVGLNLWLENGRKLKIPDVLSTAVESYRVDADPVAQFIEDRCDHNTNTRETTDALYAAFVQWWGQTQGDEKPMTKRSLGMALDDLGFAQDRGAQGVRMRRGLRLENEGI